MWPSVWVLVVSSFMLSACVATPGTRQSRNEASPQLPTDAIQVEEDLYMVAIGVDEAGCQQYSAWSATRGVVAAVYYRQEDGAFTLFRSRAACN